MGTTKRGLNNHIWRVVQILKKKILKKPTLKGSLSVLKAIPGTYFNQTGNPLHPNRALQKITEVSNSIKVHKIYLNCPICMKKIYIILYLYNKSSSFKDLKLQCFVYSLSFLFFFPHKFISVYTNIIYIYA